MSVGTLSTTPDPWGQSLDCPHRPVRVYVSNVEIPVSKVTTELTKEGPANINKLTEIYFPGEWEGKDVVQYVRSFDPTTQDTYDTVRVEWKPNDADDDAFETAQFGYVRGVAGTDVEGELRMWVSDPATLTTAIPYTNSFEDTSHVSTALRDVAQTFRNRTVFSSIAVDVKAPLVRRMRPGSRSFTGNRDTLKDALDYVAENTQSWWYFEWQSEGLTLVLDSTPLAESPADFIASDTAEPEGDDNEFAQAVAAEASESFDNIPQTRRVFVGDGIDASAVDAEADDRLTLLDNDAINEILPINAIRVNGKTGSSGMLGGNAPSKSWPTAKVRYTPLYERAGQNEYLAGIRESETQTIDETVNVARSQLKDALMSTGEGDMSAKGTPLVRPYDRVIAQPTCGDLLNESPSLDYEVTSVRHEADAMAGAVYKTHMDVTLFIDEAHIETVEAKMASA